MNISKAQNQKHHMEARAFIRLQLGEAVARAASHIRSKRAATLRSGIEEVREEFESEHGGERIAAFFECVELWLSDRNNMVAAAALRAYIETDVGSLPEDQDDADEDYDERVSAQDNAPARRSDNFGAPARIVC